MSPTGAELKITSIESRVLRFDISETWGAGGPPKGRGSWEQLTIDTFHTDVGIDGHTMQPGTRRGGAAMAPMLHDVYARHLVGEDPMESERLWQKLRRVNRHAYNLSDSVAGAIDVALWDIRGKVAGLPIASLLGLARDRIATYSTASHRDPTPEDVYNESRLRKSQGYRGFKVQFYDGPDRDVPRFRAAREGVGDGFPLMQDGVGMYGFVDALTSGRALEALDYAWFEEPIPDRNLFQLNRLADQLAIPILSGETLRVHELAEAMRMGVFDIARGDVMMKEGITGLRKAAGMADLLGFDLEIHGLRESLLDVANLHVAMSVENCRWSESFDPVYQPGLKGQPLEIDDDGFRHVPRGPGLGVEIDWDWVDNVTERIICTPAA